VKKGIRAAAAALLLCAAARGADVAVDGGQPTATRLGTPAPRDQSTLELIWDNGQRRWSVAWWTGAHTWVGNDFNISTLKTTNVKILKYKYYTRGAWPNERWEGMRFAVFSFRGGVPGSMLWPTSGDPYFFKPSAGIQAHIWVEFDVNWTCPAQAFIAAQEQFYDYPNCDAFSLDNNTAFLGHTWEYKQGKWTPLPEYESFKPYRNAMIRVWVETGYTFPGVAPASLGRVKALYY